MSVDPNSPETRSSDALTNGAASRGADYSMTSTPTRAEIAREHIPEPSSGVILQASTTLLIMVSIAVLSAGLVLNQFWLVLPGSIVALILSLRLLYPALRPIVQEFLTDEDKALIVGSMGAIAALIGLLNVLGVGRALAKAYTQINWEAIGALGEVFGALGQILIAILAVYIAWRQYVISKDLTIQQNIITQQQTIDTYFQGISDLVLDEEGLLEDWPQERAIAEGRTAAILSSVDGSGKAKIIRFLSRARLLTPLKRDQRLGRAILDGSGGYAEDRVRGVRVIDLGVMLAAAELAKTDLRWTDLSDANLIRADLSKCDLVKANLSRTILVGAKLRSADLTGTRLFYGSVETASPRSRIEPPDYKTGAHTGAVIENADFTDVEDMSQEQRQYCCAWCGSKSRKTIPGGCEGIPNKLGR
jgi:uncharacterized protein YjbI with pentapeptide repeats